MEIADAQRDVRTAFHGGFVGQLVSGLIWLTSAALGTWRSPASAIWVLFVGGALIYPLTVFGLRVAGFSGRLRAGNSLGQLARQLTFTLNLPLVAAATLYHLNWFYPACLFAVGAHFVPFVFLYGMRLFAILAAVMMASGLVIALYVPGPFALGGWVGAVTLIVFAFALRAAVRREADARFGAPVSAPAH